MAKSFEARNAYYKIRVGASLKQEDAFIRETTVPPEKVAGLTRQQLIVVLAEAALRAGLLEHPLVIAEGARQVWLVQMFSNGRVEHISSSRYTNDAETNKLVLGFERQISTVIRQVSKFRQNSNSNELVTF